MLERIKKIVTNKRHISTGAYTASRMAAAVLQAVGGILLVRLLDPKELGFFNRNTVVLGYLLFLTLGVFSGLSREYPFYMGKNERDQADRLASAANAFAIALGLLIFIVFAFIGLRYAFAYDWKRSAVWFANSISGYHIMYKAYLGVTFRTHYDFVKLAGIDLSVSIATLLSLFFVWQWKYYGLCIRTVVVALVSIVLLFWHRPVRARAKWNFENLFELFKVGLPIYFTGYVIAWWSATLSTTWIAWRSDAMHMGLYSFPSFVFTTITLCSNSFTQVYYPRLTQAYAANGNIMALFKMLKRPLILLLIIHMLIMIAGWLAMPYAVKWIAPKYVRSIFPAQLMLLNLLIYWFDPALRIFYVIKRTGIYTICIAAGIVLNIILLYMFRNNADILTSVILSNIGGRGLYRVISILVLMYFVREEKNLNLKRDREEADKIVT